MKELRRDPGTRDIWPQNQTEKKSNCCGLFGFFFSEFLFVVISRLDLNGIFVLKWKHWSSNSKMDELKHWTYLLLLNSEGLLEFRLDWPMAAIVLRLQLLMQASLRSELEVLTTFSLSLLLFLPLHWKDTRFYLVLIWCLLLK